jgi:DinB superfamily
MDTNFHRSENCVTSVLHSFAYSLDYLREQLADVTDADRVAQPGGIANHPAWIIGHLTFSCQLLAAEIGVEPWLPGSWAARYGTGSVPQADAGAYESKDKLLAHLNAAQARISAAVASLDPGRLDQPLPDPVYREVFPTVCHAITQVLVAHTSFHVGQISAWRAAMGLPRMMRGFE